MLNFMELPIIEQRTVRLILPVEATQCSEIIELSLYFADKNPVLEAEVWCRIYNDRVSGRICVIEPDNKDCESDSFVQDLVTQLCSLTGPDITYSFDRWITKRTTETKGTGE